MNDTHSLSHTSWNCKYHVVFATKYRRKVFYESKRIEIGKILRETSLDELPELFNVFFGDMSIVGPRPQLVKDMVFMCEEHRKRHRVRPGLTGLAQINGRNAIDWEKKLDYDLHQRKVLVITGIRSKVKGLKPVIDKHHGLFRGLDASAEEKVSSSKLKREIRDADFVIVCIDAIHHRISQLANHHAKRYEKPLAIANVTSNTAVERAIARALNGDPAYAESSEDLKNYK